MEKIGHTVYIDRSACCGWMRCLKVCPTEAMRVRQGRALILEDRCIDCGECVRACPSGACKVETQAFEPLDGKAFKVALVSPTFYSQFPRTVSPAKIHRGLKKLGFDEVRSVADYCESVGLAIQHYMDLGQGPRPAISSFCPTVIRLVRVLYPDLVDHVIPLETPREIAARDARQELAAEHKLRPGQIKTVYLTPCPSRMLSIKNRRSTVDQAVPIKDIYGPLLNVLSGLEKEKDSGRQNGVSRVGVSWARLGGISKELKRESWIEVAGIANIIRIFDDIEQGKLRDIEFIEAFACQEGCIGGSLNVENVYVARSRNISLSNVGRNKPLHNRKEIAKLFGQGYFKRNQPIMPRPQAPLDDDLGRAIQKMKEKEIIFKGLPRIDCGACGCPSCSAFAEDVVKGEISRRDCVVLRARAQQKRGARARTGKSAKLKPVRE